MARLAKETAVLADRIRAEVVRRIKADEFKALVPFTSGFSSLDDLVRHSIVYVPVDHRHIYVIYICMCVCMYICIYVYMSFDCTVLIRRPLCAGRSTIDTPPCSRLKRSRSTLPR